MKLALREFTAWVAKWSVTLIWIKPHLVAPNK